MPSRRLGCVLALLALLAAAGPARSGLVLDEIGHQVNVPAQPRRLIGLTPSLTEILFALGLGDRVVGATTWADFPPEALKLPRVGAYVSPNLEQIVALNPDVVLANREGNPPFVLDKLEGAGLPVYVTRPDDPMTLPESFARLGEICGVPEAGRALARKLEDQFARVAARLRGAEMVPTLLVLGSQPVVSVSPESFNGRLLTMAHGLNVAAPASGRWPRLSLEFVLEAQPKVVIVSTMERGQNLEKELQFWRRLPGLGNQPGLRVRSIPSDIIDRPGPRVGLGLETLARIIHPERFEPEGQESR